MNSTPVMNEAPFTNSTPTMNSMASMDNSSSVNGQFIPTGMPATGNQTYNNMPAPKKSKAPLFIILGISILAIAIVAIVLVIIFTGDDSPSSGKEKKSTKTEVSTDRTSTSEKESDTEETTPASGSVGVLNDAISVAEDFMYYMSIDDFDSASEYFLQSYGDYAADEFGYTISEALTYAQFVFVDTDYNFLDYEIGSADEYDDSSFYSAYEPCLKEYDSYVAPESFAQVEVLLSYKDQTSSIYLELACCDGNYYVYNFNIENFYIEFEDESESTSTEVESYSSTFPTGDLSSVVTGGNSSVYGEPSSGTRVSGDGFSLIIPDGWSEVATSAYYDDLAESFGFTSDDSSTPFMYTSDDSSVSLSAYTVPLSSKYTDIANYLKEQKELREMIGYTVSDISYVTLSSSYAIHSGYEYYSSYSTSIDISFGSSHDTTYNTHTTRMFIIEVDSVAYVFSISTDDTDCEAYEEAVYSVATLLID